MTWDGLRDRRKRSDADDTHICRVDNLLRNQAETIERLNGVIVDLDDQLVQARARLFKSRALNALAALGAAGGALVACHPW